MASWIRDLGTFQGRTMAEDEAGKQQGRITRLDVQEIATAQWQRSTTTVKHQRRRKRRWNKSERMREKKQHPNAVRQRGAQGTHGSRWGTGPKGATTAAFSALRLVHTRHCQRAMKNGFFPVASPNENLPPKPGREKTPLCSARFLALRSAQGRGV